jgi:hypothetical protein
VASVEAAELEYGMLHLRKMVTSCVAVRIYVFVAYILTKFICCRKNGIRMKVYSPTCCNMERAASTWTSLLQMHLYLSGANLSSWIASLQTVSMVHKQNVIYIGIG